VEVRYPPPNPSYRADDALLVSGLLANAPGAWRAFDELYGELIHRAVAGVTRRSWRVVSPTDTLDACAVFYASLLANDMRKLRTFDPHRGSPFSAWIRVVATRSTLDYVRRARRALPTSKLDDAEEMACADDPHADIERKQDSAVLAELLSNLTERDRQLVRLHFFEGLSPFEAADRMNVSVRTVYSKKNKIVARLQLLFRRAALHGYRHSA
jgi:RNA polymerase sigma-70 factor, ECF subfamily